VSRLPRENVGASTSHSPVGLHGLLQGWLYLFSFKSKQIEHLASRRPVARLNLLFWKWSRCVSTRLQGVTSSTIVLFKCWINSVRQENWLNFQMYLNKVYYNRIR
jgi:hypothetical protein